MAGKISPLRPFQLASPSAKRHTERPERRCLSTAITVSTPEEAFFLGMGSTSQFNAAEMSPFLNRCSLATKYRGRSGKLMATISGSMAVTWFGMTMQGPSTRQTSQLMFSRQAKGRWMRAYSMCHTFLWRVYLSIFTTPLSHHYILP